MARLHKCNGRELRCRDRQPKIEVSSMYYDWRNRQLPAHERGNVTIDLRFATMMKTLGLPLRDAHDALSDAVMAGLAFIKLRWLLGEGKASRVAPRVTRSGS